MEIRSYKQAINYLGSFISPILFRRIEENPQFDPLERMRTLLNLLGNPQEKLKSVLITGTAGKGSTAYLISHLLTTAGYKTGFTLSPHLQKINERLQIDGKQISDLEFTKLTASMIRIIETMEKMAVGKPSYFEILIAMAFKYFEDQKVDIAVVEVGIEGKYDATSLLTPLIVVLTNIYLDHTQILGETVEEIAKEAVGVIKKTPQKQIVITGTAIPSIIKIVEDKCREVEAQLNLLWRDFGHKVKKESIKGSIFDLTINSDRIQKLNDLQLSLIGKYQIENASLAVKTALELKKFSFKVSENQIRQALQTAFFPGRFELINYTLDAKRYTLVLDGAHNPAKMKAFLKSLEKIFPKKRKIFVIGFKFDKDIKKMLKQILDLADEIIITQFKAKTDVNIHASAKVLNLQSLIFNLKSNVKVTIEKDSGKALKKALKMQPEIIVVTGSLYLVGEIRNML